MFHICLIFSLVKRLSTEMANPPQVKPNFKLKPIHYSGLSTPNQVHWGLCIQLKLSDEKDHTLGQCV